MISEEEEKNNFESSNIKDLFEKTVEFDIIKYIIRGILQNQQNCHNQIIDLRLNNMNLQNDIISLSEEIKKIKSNNYQENGGNISPIIYNTYDKIEEEKQKLLKEKINLKIDDIEKMKNFNQFNNNQNIKEEHNNIKEKESIEINNNNDLSKDNNKKNDIKMIKILNSKNEKIINNNRKDNDNNFLYENMISSSSNVSELKNELNGLKTKYIDIEKKIDQNKNNTEESFTLLNKNIPEQISNQIILLKEEHKNQINTLNENFEKKIYSLKELIQNLEEQNEEKEQILYKFGEKMKSIKEKFDEYLTKTDYEVSNEVVCKKIEKVHLDINDDLTLIKRAMNSMKTQILEISTDTVYHDNLDRLVKKQEAANIKINKLLEFQKDFSEKEKRRDNSHFDPNKFVDIEQFTEFTKNQNKINDKNKKELTEINKDLEDIKTSDLLNKATLKDLKKLEDKIFSKFDEFLAVINEKYLERKVLQKYTKIIEYQTKQTLEEFKANLRPQNWIMAKKPVGHLCACCEAYLGDLKVNMKDKFIHWNKLPLKESTNNDNKNNVISGGNLSRIVKMVNNYEAEKGKISDQEKNEDNEEKHKLVDKNIMTNSNSNNISNRNANINRINYNISFQNENYYEDEIIHSLPSIKKKILSANNSNSEELGSSFGKDKNLSIGLRNSRQFIAIAKHEIKKRKDLNLSPKITKIFKKIKKKDKETDSLNKESKDNNDNK